MSIKLALSDNFKMKSIVKISLKIYKCKKVGENHNSKLNLTLDCLNHRIPNLLNIIKIGHKPIFVYPIHLKNYTDNG